MVIGKQPESDNALTTYMLIFKFEWQFNDV